MRAPDFFLIPALVAGELRRRFARWLRCGPLFKWRLSGSTPEGLTLAPRDLRPAEEKRASHFYAGEFTLANETVTTSGQSVFSTTDAGSNWTAQLHSFRWLGHLRAAETEIAHANASAFVTDWISLWGNRTDTKAWAPDVTAYRIIAWLSHAPLISKHMSDEDYKGFLRSITRQTRYLSLNMASTRDGYPKLHVCIALAYASLCLTGRDKSIRQCAKDLDRELDRQILPDGGHISRNPVNLVEILADLLPLKRAYDKRGHSPSAALVSAIDRMMGAIRFFRHSNGDLAQFNGTGETPGELLETILRYDEVRGGPLQSAPQSGYERLATGSTVVLMDTGIPLTRSTAQRAMAGTLAFELSSGGTRFIVNCGVTEGDFRLYAPFACATAAHSTATIGNTSSSRFAHGSTLSRLLPSPLLRGPEHVEVSRDEEDGFAVVRASHDGYVDDFGLTHARELYLSDNGSVLNGSDCFIPSGSRSASPSISLRFHLPVTVNASLLSSGHSILLAGPNNDAWTFTCVDAPISLEESVQFSGSNEPRKSEQIVITTDLSTRDEIRWTLERRKAQQTSRPRRKTEDEAAAPDLLSALELQQASQG